MSAVLLLALGIGATTAIFSLVDATILRPLPFRDAARLVKVYERSPTNPRNLVSINNLQDWAVQSTSFAALAGTGGGGSTTIRPRWS